jgi:hypothetical protein
MRDILSIAPAGVSIRITRDGTEGNKTLEPVTRVPVSRDDAVRKLEESSSG